MAMFGVLNGMHLRGIDTAPNRKLNEEKWVDFSKRNNAKLERQDIHHLSLSEPPVHDGIAHVPHTA